ncbi:FAD-dependent oxidoreductase [Nocardia sp. 2]|uniref:FAD-dependent oxidoreductase n=1 Tax=Nocardia acididurans TaxID=2802282 RepID=A0ABS1LYP9_9NOCA|nr:FAD-dependent oxidoreductase [Nocardia acididurans]MBL1073542.1 FAD-dependent oxidoreductase [Nocardia acididurans]
MAETTTVAVIGAGFAGLTTARTLRAHGVDVLVLEAADRVGGRAHTVHSTVGSAIDLGGQWIGHDHTRMIALAKEFGSALFPTHTAGRTPLVDGADQVRPLSLTTAAAALTFTQLALLTHPRFPALRQLRSDTEGRIDRALDRITVAQWLARMPGRRGPELAGVVLGEALAADLGDVSVAALIAGVRSAGGLRVLLGTAGGAQESLVTGGVGGLAERLAAELGTMLRLGHPVTAISRSDAGVTIESPAGIVRADRVVVTVPPPVAAAIQHEPPLPEYRNRLQRNTFMGTIYKAVAVYDRPFWRDDGLSGELVDLSGPAPAAFDSSPPGGPGHLCVLVPGQRARALDRLAPAERRDTILRALAQHFGERTRHPVDWHEKAWHLDDYVGGGYAALPRPGHVGILATAAEPIGPVHWAGTETAPRWTGYLEGAVASGERAAQEVVAALRATPARAE